MIQVVVCSAIPALRAGLRALVAGDPALAVVAAAPALEDLPGWSPQTTLVVATPDAMPAGWETGGETWPGGPGLVMSDLAVLLVSDEPRHARALLGLGLRAWGLVSPEAPAEALQAAARALAEGLAAVSPGVLRELVERRPAPEDGPGGPQELAPGDRLTGREVEVLGCLAQGLANKQIARALGISEHTVKFHVASIYAKLGVNNRTEASRKGARLGIIPL